MRIAMAGVVACCTACVDKEPTLTLADLPDLFVHVGTTELPWTSADPPGESRVEIMVLVFHDYDRRVCPQLESSFAVIANGVALADIELGGFDENDSCDHPGARVSFVQSADLGTDVDVVVSDRSRAVHASYPDLLKRSTISVVEPLGALPPAAKVRLAWAPEDLAMATTWTVDTTFTQLASPYSELEMRSGYAFVEGNEVRLSIPDTLTWTGPTQLAISRVHMPGITVPCELQVCSGQRTAAAAVTVDVQ